MSIADEALEAMRTAIAEAIIERDGYAMVTLTERIADRLTAAGYRKVEIPEDEESTWEYAFENDCGEKRLSSSREVAVVAAKEFNGRALMRPKWSAPVGAWVQVTP